MHLFVLFFLIENNNRLAENLCNHTWRKGLFSNDSRQFRKGDGAMLEKRIQTVGV